MADVEFEQEEGAGFNPQRMHVPPSYNVYGGFSQSGPQGGSWLVRAVIKTGLARDMVQANYILIGVAALFFVVSIYFFFFSGPPRPKTIQPIPGSTPQNDSGVVIPAGRP